VEKITIEKRIKIMHLYPKDDIKDQENLKENFKGIFAITKYFSKESLEQVQKFKILT